MLARRADYTIGSHSLSAFDYVIPGSAIDGIAAFKTAAASWRKALTTADDGALDQVGRSDYPGRQRSGAALPGADFGGSTRRCCTTAPTSCCSAISITHGSELRNRGHLRLRAGKRSPPSCYKGS
jgi:hypothetical protein